MKTLRLLLLLFCSFCAFSLFAQLDFKIQLMPDGTKWGIYAVPQTGTVPTANTITGSGQITMVAPLNFTIVDFNSVNGYWASNAVINGPTENPTKTYISFGLINDVPKIPYSATAPTLLFTFRKASNYCPNELYLIENTVDPFDQLPNSANSNPGNEITVLDFGISPPSIYEYGKNIAPFAWDCHDCDGDGIANAYEDTNGDGVWTPGVDASDLCNGGGSGCVEITGAQLYCENGGTSCGNNPTGPLSLVIGITGGQAPYTVKYTDGSSINTLQNYQSGTPFPVAAVNGAVYSLVEITESEGCVANPGDFIGVVEVSLPGAIQFTLQPSGATACNTESASFQACATATNSSLDIRWEFSSNQGATWQDVTSASGVFSESSLGNGCKTLYVNNVNGLDGYRFRAIAEGTNVSPATSQAASLTVQGPLSVASQPQNIKVCNGETVVFNADIVNNGGGNIEYTWQLSHNNGATWWDGMPAAGTSGINSNQLTIQNIPSQANGDIYRLRARVGDCGFVYSQSALLTVEGPVEILAVLSPATVCRGESACFEVQASLFGGGQLSYQWQERPTGSATWTNVQGATAPIFCLANTDGRNGYCYRALVRTESCPAVTSVEACLVVEDKAVFAQQPQNSTICSGETATLTANAAIEAGYAGQVEYRWQTSADGGQTWIDLDNDFNFEGASSETLTIHDAASVGNLLYRLGASAGICGAAYSDAASVTLEGPLEISAQPTGMAICPGSGASFTASANLLGAGSLHLQWQASTNGTYWTDIAEGGNYAGAQAGTLTVQNATAGRLFRLSASTGHCAAIFSEPALLAVEAPILFSQQPEGATACPDEAASFTIGVSGGSGALLLQWQSSQDGQTWTDIAEGGNYAGTHSPTLTIAAAAGLGGTQYRLAAASQNCSANSAAAVLTLEDDATCNPTPGYQDCVSLAVKKLDDGIGWSVWVRADSSFTETPYQLPTGGKVTLVAPIGFAIQALTSHNGGKWKHGTVSFNPPQDPGKVYFEFNLTPNQNFLELTPGAERLLFNFSVVNGCPPSLTLMDGIVPPGFSRNEFTGFGAGLTQEEIPFHSCGVYGQDEWECPPTMNLMAPTGGNTVASSQQLDLDPSAVQADFGQKTSDEIEPTSFFGVAPNPTRGELTVAFDENILEKTASLRLWNLQGQLLNQEVIEGEATHRLDLGQHVPGIYFLTLEVDGKLVQREKIIVQ